jgi:hypothetical protein
MTLAEVGYPVYVLLPQTYMTLAEVGYPVYALLVFLLPKIFNLTFPSFDCSDSLSVGGPLWLVVFGLLSLLEVSLLSCNLSLFCCGA